MSGSISEERGAGRERLVVLANTKATRCPADLDRLVEPLRSKYSVRVVKVDQPKGFSERIREAARDADVLVIGSGDGTLARSGAALLESGCVLGVLPLGNANDLARGLGMPLEVEEACRALIDASPTGVDVGRVNSHYFFNAATIGVGADISSGMDAQTKRRWKRFSQVPNFFAAIRDRRSFPLKLHVEGSVRPLRSIHVTIANGRTIGGGIVVDEQAMLDDRRLDFSSVRPQTFGELVRLAPAMIFGRRKHHPRVDFVSVSRLRIETSRPLPIATDGDIVTETPAEFECLPGALRFLVPNDPAASLAVEVSH